MKIILAAVALIIPSFIYAQELYSSTEPASNIAAGSIGIRVDNSIMNEVNSKKQTSFYSRNNDRRVKEIHGAGQCFF